MRGAQAVGYSNKLTSNMTPLLSSRTVSRILCESGPGRCMLFQRTLPTNTPPAAKATVAGAKSEESCTSELFPLWTEGEQNKASQAPVELGFSPQTAMTWTGK